MATTYRLEMQWTDGVTHPWEAGEWLDGHDGDTAVAELETLTAPGVDGSRHALRRRQWEPVRLRTVREVGDWTTVLSDLQRIRQRVGEAAAIRYQIAGGSWILTAEKRALAVQLAPPQPTVAGWLLTATWTLRREDAA